MSTQHFCDRCTERIPNLRTALEVIGVESLAEMIDHLCGKNSIAATTPVAYGSRPSYGCFSEVRGQDRAKRALAIAAAGAFMQCGEELGS